MTEVVLALRTPGIWSTGTIALRSIMVCVPDPYT